MKLKRSLVATERSLVATAMALCLAAGSAAHAQLPGIIYTFDGGPAGWSSATASRVDLALGELNMWERENPPGQSVTIGDDFALAREYPPTASGGGLDLTGLEYLEFDLGHNGYAPVNVTFFARVTPSHHWVSLGPDQPVTPGVHTYQAPLAALSLSEILQIRQIGFTPQPHGNQGNLIWTLREVRSAGTPLTERDLITHAAGTPEGGLQGAIVSYDGAAVLGHNPAQKQTGLSWNSVGTGSLQWTDIGGSNGAAITWGNGAAWDGNTFFNRHTDLTGYVKMIVRMSATDPSSGDGAIDVSAFFQKNNFQTQAAEAGAVKSLPIDGQFHDLVWSLNGLDYMRVVDQTGIDLAPHGQSLVINVDNIRFMIPEPATLTMAVTALALFRRAWRRRRQRGLESI